MSEPLSIKDMPYITTEQVARYRSASLAIEQQRDELLEALKDATPQPQEDKVRELEKEVSLWKSRANQLSCAGDGQSMSDYWLEVDALILKNQEATPEAMKGG